MELEHLYEKYLSCNAVSIDSRTIQAGDLFFAIKGPNFDGNQYAEAALQAGARFAVVSDAALASRNDRMVLVDDTVAALQQLARQHRRQFGIPVFALTGSNGKTTTKELCAAVLSTQYRTHFTQGNLNNHLGVPLSLLAMPRETEIAVIEMGANHQGEIAALCRIAAPTHGLITNIGKAHLEGFGGLAGVKKGKGELYAYLSERPGVAFFNRESQDLWDLVRDVPSRIAYGESGDDLGRYPYEARYEGEHPSVELSFQDRLGHDLRVTSNLFGYYNFTNMLAAIVLGKYFKVPALKIKAALESYVPSNNRSQLLKRGSNTFILDAYNANPTSMEVALRHFAKRMQPQKVAILGDMLELGPDTEMEHRHLLRYVKDLDIKQIVLVGELFYPLKDDFPTHLFFQNLEELQDWFAQQEWKETTFLLKASRRLELERLISQTDEAH